MKVDCTVLWIHVGRIRSGAGNQNLSKSKWRDRTGQDGLPSGSIVATIPSGHRLRPPLSDSSEKVFMQLRLLDLSHACEKRQG